MRAIYRDVKRWPLPERNPALFKMAAISSNVFVLSSSSILLTTSASVIQRSQERNGLGNVTVL
jgi:hypothetical protein